MTERIVPSHYVDAFSQRRTVAPEARQAVLDAMGLEPGEEPDDAPVVAVVPRRAPLPGRGELVLEDGASLGRASSMPDDAPYGYHHLIRDDGVDQLLITGPGRCHLPSRLRAWGWAVQLAAVRSRASWGIGDLDDLRRLAAWSADQGAGWIGVSPLGAPNPGPSPEPSPYYPSTRRFGSPIHVAIDALPGADRVGVDAIAKEARRLNDDARLDRPRVMAAKAAALERIWTAGIPDRDAFDAWRASQGGPLDRWATFCVLSERFGPGWQSWPEPYHDPRSPAVARLAEAEADRRTYHAWVQWCFDHQLEAASAPLRRVADMPVGVDPGGFDAWDWRDQVAIGASIGAPPDRFNTAGQDWGLPPFIPHRLRAAHYRPFVDTIRCQLRHAGGLRIDHVLGLFRLWWVPDGAGPAEGAYVHYPTAEMLEIVALESHRARAIIVGEDLGTVPTGVREELRRRRLLSTRLVLFERVPPARYPRQALAAVTTHDLPTIAGLLSGADFEDQAAAGVEPDPANVEVLRSRLLAGAEVTNGASATDVNLRLHQALAAAPPALVAATLEDALGVRERINLPGTVAPQRDNWNLALPLPLEEIERDERVSSTVAALAR
jgi:4-alpha-glucanotransferase